MVYLANKNHKLLISCWRCNYKSPLRFDPLLEAKLARSQAARIVFIGSVYGGAGSALEVGYSTVKGAQSAFCKAYSKEVASLGITVNTLAPGAIDTQMNQMFSGSERQAVKEEIPSESLCSAK